MNRKSSPPGVKPLVWILLAIVLIGTSAALAWWQMKSRSASSMDTDDARIIAQGRAVYDQHCASCHGGNLEGQPHWRSRLSNGRLPAPPHDASGHTWHHPGQVLFGIVKNGVQASAPAGYESDMPAFGGVLPDAEIWAVLAYIRSTWPRDIQRKHEALEQANRNR